MHSCYERNGRMRRWKALCFVGDKSRASAVGLRVSDENKYRTSEEDFPKRPDAYDTRGSDCWASVETRFTHFDSIDQSM